MKKFILFGLFVFVRFVGFASGEDGKYPYDTVAGDPLHGRIYHLPNGLTVFISVNKAEPKIQTLISVKAGSKYDPSDATGLAHYLEHMLFKGTTHYGTTDYAKEKPLLDIIENLFETYRHTTDANKRKAIYRKIDSVSGIASKYAIANEYAKMMDLIGAEGTNAHTTEDKTVFEENIPANELDTWLEIESDRFKNPVMRLFHTELEVVYEEKNMRLDDRSEIMSDALMNGLFPNHPYGQHTILGTIHDLKNPSIKDILNYFNTYYVPNNMVISLSGDVNPDEAIQKIDNWFGTLAPHKIPAFIILIEDSISQPVIKTITDPGSAFVEVGYRFGGAASKDADMLRLLQKMLSNGKTGLLETDLGARLNSPTAVIHIMKDHSVLFLAAAAREDNLTPEQIKDSLIKEVNKLVHGEFSQWLVEGAVNNLKVDEMNDFRSNFERAQRFVDVYATDESWSSSVNRINRISKITRNDVIGFAKTHFKNNYVVVYKRKGEEESKEKIIKPLITPVQTNPNAESAFLKKIENEKPEPLQPIFADYANRIRQYELKPGLTLYFVKNKEDSLFDLTYSFDIGSNNNRELEYALQLFNNGSTSYFNTRVIKQEFYRMGCTFTYHVNFDNTTIELKGLSKNFIQALNLLESMFNDISFGHENWEDVMHSLVTGRNERKNDWNSVFYGLNEYAIYGPNSPYTTVLTERQINSIQPEDLQRIIRSLRSYPHSISYYGPSDAPHLIANIQQYHKTPDRFLAIPRPIVFRKQAMTNNVFIYNTSIRQAQVYICQPGAKYNPQQEPIIAMYNQYFSGSRESPVWETLRESDALSYSANSSFLPPIDTINTGCNFTAFSTQADKLASAIDGMVQLLYDTLTYYPNLWSRSKEVVEKNISSVRVNREQLVSNYLKAKRLGLGYDIKKNVFEQLPTVSFKDIQNFHNKYIANQPYNIVIIGNAQLIDLNSLSKYGKITYLKQSDIFGF